MRRLAAFVLAVVLVLPAGIALGQSSNYRDEFGSGGYSGNDGSLEFSGSWSEFGDTGGSSSGAVHIGEEFCSNNRCLHLEGSGLVPVTLGIQRSADLSGFQSAELSFDLMVATEDPLGLTTGQLRVRVRSNGSWTNLGTFNLRTPVSQHKSYSLAGHLTEDFAVQFQVPGLLGGQVANWLGYATIDKVDISGLVEEVTTTSTTPTTTSTSTTSTTQPKVTTTSSTPTTTPTTGEDSTTTTIDGLVTETTSPRSTPSTRPGAGGQSSDPAETTTTTVSGSTTTTEAGAIAPFSGPPSDGGLRDPGIGLITNYASGMMGDMGTEGVEVLSADLKAEFSLAVEAVEAAKLWIALLALIIGAAFVGGLDRRRTRREAAL